MRKEQKRLRCALLNGSAWTTGKKYMRRFNGTFEVFFGIEPRLRKEEMEEQLNKEAREGWGFAASAARITEERQELRIASTRQEEFWWQSTATLERLWEQKKERLSRFQEMKEESHKHG